MPGKISEYTNNGNIDETDLLDYSHENEPGSGNWETRSITLAQLRTAVGAGQSSVSITKQVCQVVPSITGWPDQGITWFFLSGQPIRFEPTWTQNILNIKELNGLEQQNANVNVRISSFANDWNDTGWDLRLVNPVNDAEYVSLGASFDQGATTVKHIGGSYGNFAPGWTQHGKQVNLYTDFYNNFTLQEGRLDLYVSNNGEQITTITNCHVEIVIV